MGFKELIDLAETGLEFCYKEFAARAAEAFQPPCGYGTQELRRNSVRTRLNSSASSICGS